MNDAITLIDRYLESVPLRDEASGEPRKSEAGQAILSGSGELRIRALIAGLERLADLGARCEGHTSLAWAEPRWSGREPSAELKERQHHWVRRQELHALLAAILERALPCTWEDTRGILRAAGEAKQPLFDDHSGPLPGFVPMLTKQIQKHGAGQPARSGGAPVAERSPFPA